MSYVLREFPQTKVLLVGSGWEDGGQAYLLRMRELVTQLGLEQSVIFTGFRTDIAAILRAINVAVQPSLSENSVTIETLLMECPTVATRVGGMTDSVLDGQTGVLVEPSNPASLGEGILRLLRDQVVAKQYSAAGRRRMLARFTLRHTVHDLASLYRRKLGEKRGYRPYVIGIRFVTGSLLCMLIVLRYVLLDATILRYWDRGLRLRRNADR